MNSPHILCLVGAKELEPTSKLKDYYVYNIIESLDELKNDKKEINSSNSFEWLKAIEEEINSINRNEVWK